jgi:hypothetical protein
MTDAATLEQPVVTQTAQPQEQMTQAAPDATQKMAESLWNLSPTAYQDVMQPAPEPAAPPVEQPVQEVRQPAVDDAEVVGLDDYFQREYGMNSVEFKSKWEEFSKPKEPVPPQEIKWSYDDSKEQEIYDYIHQKRELDKLEKLEVTNDNQAAEILRANLQFKYKGTLTTQEIDRLFSKQYSLPSKPTQSLDQADEEYAETVKSWESQVNERKMDMIIEAKMARPDLLKYKEQIVQPEIQKPQVQQQGPTQEELARAEAGRKAYLNAVESGYQNFKGFSVTAKDGDVQLPINYNVSPEELTASKQTLQDFNVNDFFDKRWFDEQGNAKVTLMQEDLYVLANRDKIYQKIANEAAAQMKAQMIKSQNNINLTNVNPVLGPTRTGVPAKTESQALAEGIWAL